MGVYLSQPKLDKDSKEYENKLLKCGASSMQGWRMSQEDAHNAILDFDEEIALFGVYDGHGGHEVAEYSAEHLPAFIKNSEAYKKGDFERALRESFLGFDATLKTDAVLAILKEIADDAKKKKKPGCPDETHDDDEDERDETAKLREEANMPLDEVIAKYATLVQTPRNKLLAGTSKPMSPFLRAARSSSSGDAKVSSSSSSFKSMSNGFPESNGETKADDQVETAGNSKTTGGPSSSTTSVESDVDQHEVSSSSQNGELAAASSTSKDQQLPDSSSPVSSGSKTRRCKKISETTTASLLAGNSSGDDEEEEEDSENDESFRTVFVTSSDSDEEDEEGNGEAGEDDEEDDEEDEDEEDDEDEDDEACGVDLVREDEEPGKDSGCTAVVALVTKDRLIVANAGDSRAVLCRDGVAVDLSVDHKPEDAVELKRIEKAGGTVSSEGRVNGGLNLSRALGDHLYKKAEGLADTEQMITALPDIHAETIDRGKDEFVVLACDGIWNSASSQQVVDFVRQRLIKGLTLVTICEQLFDECLAPDTVGDGTGCDNMTCVIVQFKPLNGSDTLKRPREEVQADNSVTENDGKEETVEDEALVAPIQDKEPAVKKLKSDEGGS